MNVSVVLTSVHSEPITSIQGSAVGQARVGGTRMMVWSNTGLSWSPGYELVQFYEHGPNTSFKIHVSYL